MLKHKSLQLVRTFSEKEFERLGDFLRSPYHNKNAKLIDLYSLLAFYWKEEVPEEWAYEQAYKHLFPEKPLGGNNLSVLLTQFHKLLEQFLIQERLKSDESDQENFLLEALALREGFEDLFQKHWEKANEHTRATPNNAYQHLSLFRLEALMLRHAVHTQNRQNKPNIERTLNELECFILAEYFRYSLAAVNNGRVLQEEFSPKFLQLLLNYLAKEPLEAYSPIIQLYFHALNCFLAEENLDLYTIFKQKLLHLAQFTKPSEAFELYLHCINYLIRRNRKEGNLLPEIFEFYQDAEEKKLFYQENGKLHPSMFNSIATTGLALSRQAKEEEKKAEYRLWVENFIERNQAFLPKIEREYAVAYVRAFSFFSDKNYSQALKALPQNSKDVISEFSRRRLLLRIYYELGEFESFFSACESTEKYVRRAQNVSASHKEGLLHFIQMLEKIAKIKEEASLNKVEKIRKEIDSIQTLDLRVWLIEKLKQLQN